MNTTPTRLLPVLIISLVACISSSRILAAQAAATGLRPTPSPDQLAANAASAEKAFNGKYNSLPAFPGAEGFGMYVTGGRGGAVYEVTNTQDYDPRSEDPIPGSLRDAVSQSDRTVVFRVSGTIQLKRALDISASNITIAGQSAPGDGICTRDYPFGVSGHNIIIRYVRGRLGDVSHQEEDSLDVFNRASDIIFDHCSATWSIDECFSTSGNETNVTIQWCLIGEGLNDSSHSKGMHGYGSLARSDGNVSWLYNLWAHNIERSPRLGDNYGRGSGPFFEVRSNVMYDYGQFCSGLTQGYLTVNYTDNYIRPGISSNISALPIHTPGNDTVADPSEMTYYIKGNVVDGNDTLTKDNSLFFDHTNIPDFIVVHVSPVPVVAPPIPAHVLNAQESYNAVLDNAGATLPIRDRVDARIVKEVRDRTGSIIDSQTQAGSWPELKSAPPPASSLHDGIPDDWKAAHGLNLKNPKLATTIDQNGYTYLEEYLNGTDPRIKVDYLDPKNNLSSLKPGPTQALWVPTTEEAASIAAAAAKYQKMAQASYDSRVSALVAPPPPRASTAIPPAGQ